MKKILVIRSNKQSSWGSCRAISPNLQGCYNNLSSADFEVVYFDISERVIWEDSVKDGEYFLELAKLVISFKPTEIVFVDHLPLAIDILGFLTVRVPYSALPPLVFHIYGDFTFFANSWFYVGEKLKGHKIKFIVASESQHKLVSSFTKSNSCIETFLFPVNENEYFFDDEERKSTRSRFGIDSQTKIVLYSGRISLQKNVDILINEYADLAQKSTHPTELWIVGGFDDQGAQIQGIVCHEGHMFAKIHELINTLPGEIIKTIKFFGNRPKLELRKLKNASDMFMSFSLYHDEDFGMSPAEALATGLPSLLTDWGGYSSFASHKWKCSLVPVQITQYGHELHMQKAASFFKDVSENVLSAEDRKILSQTFLDEFSITSASKKLRAILNKEFQVFQGFDWTLEQYSSSYWSVKFGKEMNKKLSPSNENFYHQVYKNYISGKNI